MGREQFSLLNGQITSQNLMKSVFRIAFTKCQAKIHLIGQLLTNQILTYFYTPECALSNGENRRSLSLFVVELFKKYPHPLTFWTDNSSGQCLANKTEPVHEI